MEKQKFGGASILKELQALEKVKLTLTTKMHILCKNHHDGKDNYAGFEEAVFEKDHNALKQQLHNVINEINDKIEELKYEEAEIEEVEES